MNLNPPRPARKNVFLVSAGSKRASLHFFVETRPVTLAGHFGGPAWEFVYECSETGFQRRFGCEERTVRMPSDTEE